MKMKKVCKVCFEEYNSNEEYNDEFCSNNCEDLYLEEFDELEDNRHETFIELEKEIEKIYKFNKLVDLLNEQLKEFNLRFNEFVASCKEYLIEIEA